MDIPQLPSNIQEVDARYCQSLIPKASSVLWSKVFEEQERIQVVMPKTEIPNWFNCVASGDTPLFWARRKFPVVALAFKFGEVKENDEIKMDTFALELLTGMMSDKSHSVGLHLFIDGQEICRKDYNCCSVGEHHVLMCDLRTLFTDEEWQGLDACVGDDWKAVQVKCESLLIINRWGIYVYKQKTNTDDIQFSLPYSKDLVPMPLSRLVLKTTSKQKIRQIRSLDLVESFGHCLNTFKSEQSSSVANELLRWCRNYKSVVRGEPPSASVYGASLKQEQEECVWDVAQILEMLMGNVAKHISDAKVQSAGQLVVKLLTTWTQTQPVKVNIHEVLHINKSIPVMLDECECDPCVNSAEALSRRYWGSVELEEGDPLVWRIWKGKEDFRERTSIVLLKCQRCSIQEASSSTSGEYLEEEYKDQAVEELLRRIEQDAMGLNRCRSKLKASFVPMDVAVSDIYMIETAVIKGQERLGRLGSNFSKTPYGKLRVELDANCNINVQHELRMECDARSQNSSQDQKHNELGVKHDGQSQSTSQNQSKLGWTKVLVRWIRRS